MLQPLKFTPEVLVTAPRRSVGVPNFSGEKIVYSVSAYSLEEHAKRDEIQLLDVSSQGVKLLFVDSLFRDPVWVDDETLLFFKSNGHATDIFQYSLENSKTCFVCTIKGKADHFKAVRLSDTEIAIACSAITTPQDTMFQPPASQSHSTGRVYTSLYVRHWDTWNDSNRNAIWCGLLCRNSDSFELHPTGMVNLLQGTGLESPVPPFGGAGGFDLCASGVAFVARDPEFNGALYSVSNVYYVPIASFADSSHPTPRKIPTPGLQGYSVSPRFSHSGTQLVFGRMRRKQHEADKVHMLLIRDLNNLEQCKEFYHTDDGLGGWDCSPSSLRWSRDDKELFAVAEHHAIRKLWKFPSNPSQAKDLPQEIYAQESVLDVTPVGTTDSPRLFLSTSSLIESMKYTVFNTHTHNTEMVVSSTLHGRVFGLSRSQCDEFWFKSADNRRIHALTMRPSFFDPSKKYPLAFLIHGGPENAWLDSWNTRWNPAVFAEQGYFVVLCNFTGSSGYGQDFVDGIRNNWGSKPYIDLCECWEYVRDTMPFVDVENGVALGASYGGYMINWIQGHSLGRKFKALVCHDGVFSTTNQWSTDELFYLAYEFGGYPWSCNEHAESSNDNGDGDGKNDGDAHYLTTYRRWDPSRFTTNWKTPMFVIHNELDYRIPISEGLAMFNVLQAQGISSKLLVFPDENHWVLKPENSLQWHREVFDFINSYSGIAPSPSSS